VIKLVEIKIIGGIPCIVLPEDPEDFKVKPKINRLRNPSSRDFTQVQRTKEKNCFNDLMKELKDKFRNK